MGMNINIKEFIGDKYSVEDAILVREIVENNLDKGIVLDFKGLERVQSTFLTSIFSNLINKLGREYIFTQIDVKNLSNYNDYSRVVLGTTFQ